jgi:glycerol-3-phosphate dehydrogenase subunit B
MAVSEPVLVIGGGMAGCIAALSARKAGAKVRVVRRALGATALSSGAIDVAADPVAPGGAWQSHLISPVEAARAWSRIRPNHPYAVLRDQLDRLEESLRFAADALPDLLGQPLGQNALLPTPLGTVKPSAMGQRSVLRADVATLPPKVAVVHFPLLASFDAHLVARGIEDTARAVGRPVEVAVVESSFLNGVEDALRSSYELGERLEAPGAVEKLAEDLRRRLPPGVEAVLLPAVLGRRTGDLAGKLGTLLGGLRCGEVLSPAPSLPGLRLQEALDAALQREGIQLDEAEIDATDAAKEGVIRVGGEQVRPRAAVLATGKYIGGGIGRDRWFRETVFNLPVIAGGRRVTDQFIGELLTDGIVQEQAAFRAGVRIDATLRPLDINGDPAHPRLFAAGAVICGYDPATDKTGLGVAIFTGFLAGQSAAQS